MVLRFSNQPSGTLLLHSRILAEHSGVFRAMFSGRWAKPLTAADGAISVNYFEADLLLDCEDGVTYLQTKVSHLLMFGKIC